MPTVANFAVEDGLSEAVLRRCFRETGIDAGVPLIRGGFGYLKTLAPALNQSAAGIPYVMLTDLDSGDCAPALIEAWLGGRVRHRNFLLRVAVREVEAWLLGDTEGLAGFLGVSPARLPAKFEMLTDPKLTLLLAARRSRYRRVREDIVHEAPHGPVQGPDYNGALSRFVGGSWNLHRAADRCPSLSKLLRRLRELHHRLD